MTAQPPARGTWAVRQYFRLALLKSVAERPARSARIFVGIEGEGYNASREIVV
jgi:hypothetical protein